MLSGLVRFFVLFAEAVVLVRRGSKGIRRWWTKELMALRART